LADLLMQVAAQVALPPELAQWAQRTLSALPEHVNLAEPLTDREWEVLRLIAAGCGNQEIADRMVVSVNTVKTHIRHLYEKFAVKNRVALLDHARAAHLLP
jgi:LuxR family maltose regulon positive regulatory protein